MHVAGKVVAVTGGGNGIGREVVLELLRRGARVAAVDIRRDALDVTVERAAAGDRLLPLVVDITDRPSVEALVDDVVDAFGAVDGVVNVAGIIQPFVPVAELDVAAARHVVDVNLWGTIHVVQAFLPRLLARPEGHVATFSSMGGFLPVPGQTVYGATKAAVKLFTEGLYAELRTTDVGVSVVLPGAVHTEITENSGVDAAALFGDDARVPMTEPDAAARTVVDGIERDRLHVYVGKDSRLLDVARRIAPRRAIDLVERQLRSR